MALTFDKVGSLRGKDGAKGDAGTSTRVAKVDVQPNSDVAIDQLTPSTGVRVGDVVIDAKGDAYTVASIVNDTTVHVSAATGVSLRGPAGPKGENGADGRDGTGVSIKGSVANASALPAGSNAKGDAYITQNDGHMHTWDGSRWVDVGEIKGPKGDRGEAGAPGRDGAQGQRGATWTTGSGAPTSTSGTVAGDLYLDLANGDVYRAANS